MLLNYTFTNFTSYEEAKFTMTTGKSRGKVDHVSVLRSNSKYLRTLKFSSIYGANGSGKSNFIRSMNFARDIILDNERIISGLNKYCRLDSNNKEKESQFIFEVLIDRKKYIYGFNAILSNGTFTKEWLIDNTTTPKELFLRDFSENSFFQFSLNNELTKRIEIYFEDIKEDTKSLFLTEMNRKKDDLYIDSNNLMFLKEIYKWFEQKLIFIYPDNSRPGRYNFILNTEENKLFNLLNEFDLNITAYEFQPVPFENLFANIPEPVRQKIIMDMEKAIVSSTNQEPEKYRFIFSGTDIFRCHLDETGELVVESINFKHEKGYFSLSEESDGTRRILELIEILLSTDEDVTFIVDELDRSLHPLLTEKFISEYLFNIKDRNNQLVITTHDTRLLDVNKLRRDEVWFCQNDGGESKLIRLDEIPDSSISRSDIKLENSYLAGKYKAIPKIKVK